MAAERMKHWEIDRLRLLIRNMTPRSAIFKTLRDELRALGRWKNLPRGKRWNR